MNSLLHPFLQWLAMGGYSTYVWSAYGLVFAGLFLIFAGMKWQKKRMRHKLQQWFKS